jgi:hypothetical protein
VILCDWDAPEGHPGQCCVHLFARILLTYFTSSVSSGIEITVLHVMVPQPFMFSLAF